jgi:hypothetical protein
MPGLRQALLVGWAVESFLLQLPAEAQGRSEAVAKFFLACERSAETKSRQ